MRSRPGGSAKWVRSPRGVSSETPGFGVTDVMCLAPRRGRYCGGERSHLLPREVAHEGCASPSSPWPTRRDLRKSKVTEKL